MNLTDESAERDVLAAILSRPTAFQEVTDLLGPDAFGDPRAKAIAESIWSIARRREGDLNPRSIRRELQRMQLIDTTSKMLDALTAHRPIAFLKQARRVRDLGAARRVHQLLFDLTDEVDDASDEPLEWLDDVARRVAAAADVRRDLELVPMADYLDEHKRVVDSRAQGVEQGILTSIDGIDALTGGVHLSEVTVLAARPSFGKSALALQIVNNASRTREDRHGEPAALFSSEMKRIPVIDRVVAEVGGINMTRLRRGALDWAEHDALMTAYERIRRSHAYVTDRRGWRVNEIVAQVRAWKRKVCRPRADGSIPKPLVVIDYLQRIKAATRHHSREQEVAEISDTIATMAGEVGVAVIVLAQLNRIAENRGPDELPQLSDLRESGAVEQDADNVWFVHRPDRIDQKIERGSAMVYIAKQRQGECGVVPMWFQGQHQRFEHRERDYTRTADPADAKPKKPRTRKVAARPERPDA